jgi:hypothetical protein
MAAIDQTPVSSPIMPICVDDLPQGDLAYIEMNLLRDLPVALLVCQLALPLFDEMKAHQTRMAYVPQPSDPIFKLMHSSPENFFAQVLDARIKNKAKLIENITSQVLSAVDNPDYEEKISASSIQLIQETLEMPRNQVHHSLPILMFQYYVSKKLDDKEMISQLSPRIDCEYKRLIENGTYQVDLVKIGEIRASLLEEISPKKDKDEEACNHGMQHLSISVEIEEKGLSSLAQHIVDLVKTWKGETSTLIWDCMVNWVTNDLSLRCEVQRIDPTVIQKLLPSLKRNK